MFCLMCHLSILPYYHTMLPITFVIDCLQTFVGSVKSKATPDMDFTEPMYVCKKPGTDLISVLFC